MRLKQEAEAEKLRLEQEAEAEKLRLEAESQAATEEKQPEPEEKKEPVRLTKAQKKKLQEKKRKLLTKMRGSLDSDGITPESASEIANEWMAIADTDGSGTVDFTEFTEFIKKLSPETEDGELREIFDSIDEDKSGELDKAEFGKAIF